MNGRTDENMKGYWEKNKVDFWRRGRSVFCTKVEITYHVSAWNWKGHQETLCAFHHHPIHTTEKERKKSIMYIRPKENQEHIESVVGEAFVSPTASEVVQDCGQHRWRQWVPSRQSLSNLEHSQCITATEQLYRETSKHIQQIKTNKQKKTPQCHTGARTILGKCFLAMNGFSPSGISMSLSAQN